VYIVPLVSPYNKEIAPALPAYSEFVGRSCLLLQGGRRVSGIGVMYPFEELSGYYNFGKPEDIRQGFYISPETDYQEISGLLSNEIRRDFTFVHPEFLLDEKYSVENGKIKLNNTENYQEYKVMFLTGCNTISWKTLQKLSDFYESGGTIIPTTKLPYKSSEMSEDQKVIELVQQIFGINPLNPDSTKIHVNSNAKGGFTVHIPNPNKENIQKILDERMGAFVRFSPEPVLQSDWGKFNYIHKIKDGKHIYMFTNSSDEVIDTEVILKGKHQLENWNPHNGNIKEMISHTFTNENGEVFTRCRLHLDPVRSVFYVSDKTD